MSLTGIRVEPVAPGSPEWLTKMSASKVAAVLGLSPYDSRFSLYHRMTGDVVVDTDGATPELRRGHYLEPAICQWFADQHPEWPVESGGCWQHADHDWYTASPDRLVHTDDATCGLEVKTDADSDGWGKPGTDEVPVHVRAQVMSQMDVLGTRRTYVALLSAFLEFREYVVDYDEAEATLIRGECARFMDDLANGVRPNLDDHVATLQTVRNLHPDIDMTDAEIDPNLAAEYRFRCESLKEAEAAKRLVTSQVLDLMGNARRAVCLGEPVAIRVAVGDAVPFLRPVKAEAAAA